MQFVGCLSLKEKSKRAYLEPKNCIYSYFRELGSAFLQEFSLKQCYDLDESSDMSRLSAAARFLNNEMENNEKHSKVKLGTKPRNWFHYSEF